MKNKATLQLEARRAKARAFKDERTRKHHSVKRFGRPVREHAHRIALQAEIVDTLCAEHNVEQVNERVQVGGAWMTREKALCGYYRMQTTLDEEFERFYSEHMAHDEFDGMLEATLSL